MPRKNSKAYQRKYVKWDLHGWADAEEYVPEEYFDLVLVIDEAKRQFQAWYTGLRWEGVRLRSRFKIIKWRFLRHEEKAVKDD